VAVETSTSHNGLVEEYSEKRTDRIPLPQFPLHHTHRRLEELADKHDEDAHHQLLSDRFAVSPVRSLFDHPSDRNYVLNLKALGFSQD
jgi:hypothetical protein